jgi:hypothetical protein
MKQFFVLVIAMLSFARSNGQDSLEMKRRIDSVITENEKERKSIVTKKEVLPESLHTLPGKAANLIWQYESNFNNAPFKYYSITLLGTDTFFVATYYFSNKKLIKASRLFYHKSTKREEFEQTIYLDNDKVVFSSFFDPENKAVFLIGIK